MNRLKLGVQCYSVKNACLKDLGGTLKKIAEIGYKGVEMFGCFWWDADMLRKAAEEAGLSIIGWHVSYSTINERHLYATIAYAKALGMKYLTVAMLPEEMRRDQAAWRDSAAKLNHAAKILNQYGITLGVHNHIAEFAQLEGGLTGWDILMSETDRSIAGQLDNGNALEGGADALTYLKKYPERAYTWHMKPYSLTDGPATMIGEDSIDWKATFDEIIAQGVSEWNIVEYCCTEKYDELEGIRRCYDAVRQMGY